MAVQLRKFAFLVTVLSLALPLVTQAATISKPPNNLGLVAYWSFAEGGGTVVGDHSGNANSGAFAGSPTWGAGKFGKGLTLNGSTDYVKMKTGTTLSFPDQTFTVSFWEKETAGVGNWIMSNDAVGGGWGIQDNGTVFLKDHTNNQSIYGTSATTKTKMKDGAWHHIVYVITTNTTTAASQSIVMYIDGVLDGGSYTSTTVYASNNDFFIGTRGSAGSPSGPLWPGSVDDIRIYNRGLSTTEIASLYQEKTAVSKMPNAYGLVGYWNFSEGGGTAAGDHSFNGNIGQLTNAVWTTLGKLGGAVTFDGSSSYVAMSNVVAPATSYTVSAWINPTQVSSAAIYNFGVKSGCNPSSQELRLQTTHVTYHPGCGGTLTSNAVIPTNQWTHVVLTVDSSKQASIYINGALDVGPVDESSSQSFGTGNDLIGAAWVGGVPNHYFSGQIDEVRVYSRVLSAAEISTLYGAQSATVGAAQSPGTLSNGLMGWWTFDGKDITTSFIDRTGNGFNGYLVGTHNATSSRKTIGKIGQGFSFDGTGTGGINLGNSASLTPSRFTLAAWVYFNSQSYPYNYIYSNSGDNCLAGLYGIDFKIYSNGVPSGTICNNGIGHSVSTSAIPASTWAHIAFSYDGSFERLYVNGVLKATTSNTADPGTASFNTYIGTMGKSNGSNYTLNGKLDDIRLYNRVLSASEISQLYNMGK